MKVAISLRSDKDRHGSERSILEDSYHEYFSQFGIMLYLIPNSQSGLSNINQFLTKNSIEGIILTGGNDVDPELYGENRSENLSLAPTRDKIERALHDYAVEHNLPLLGICRGMQMLNVWYQGKVIGFKEQQINHPPGKDHPHNIQVVKYADALGKETTVNSYHNQGITQQELSKQLKPFAQTADGIIEGLYHPDKPIAGIQWHPERPSPDPDFNKKLISAFCNRELFWKK